jgi:hypothetical protein
MQVTLGTLSATSPLVALGAGPGEVWTADDLTTPGGYAVTITTDGDFSVALNGDTSRQSFGHDLDGDAGVIYVNNQGPTFTPPEDYLDFTVGVDGTDVDLAAYFEDFEGDPLTYSLAPGSPAFPAWASLGLLSISIATPASATSVSPVIRARDLAGDVVDGAIPLRSLAVDIAVPDVAGHSVAAATEALEAIGLEVAASSSEFSDEASGTVLRQSPAAGVNVQAGTTVFLVLSLGPRQVVRLTTRPPVGLREFLL